MLLLLVRLSCNLAEFISVSAFSSIIILASCCQESALLFAVRLQLCCHTVHFYQHRPDHFVRLVSVRVCSETIKILKLLNFIIGFQC